MDAAKSDAADVGHTFDQRVGGANHSRSSRRRAGNRGGVDSLEFAVEVELPWLERVGPSVVLVEHVLNAAWHQWYRFAETHPGHLPKARRGSRDQATYWTIRVP
eukprot:COSAG06_NODE_11562_length_1491_cov_1.456178_2_plen_104_part_00